MGDDPLEALSWRDELLQILYWFRGEGLGDAVAPADLLPFLNAEESLVARHLERLVDDGYATRTAGAPPRYQLTELGVKEGGRRFADEFAGLTGQAHGECNDPSCACRTLGPAACESRAP
ncbi:MAG TPA: hypothetical protein VNL77_05360 [Roseiflexaceae bacterium]|nr:hypothetical protein [Roseiflexaceae bacterium]